MDSLLPNLIDTKVVKKAINNNKRGLWLLYAEMIILMPISNLTFLPCVSNSILYENIKKINKFMLAFLL